MLGSFNKGVIVCSEDISVEEVASYLHNTEEVPVIYKKSKRLEAISGNNSNDDLICESWQFYVTNTSNASKLPDIVSNEDNKVILFVGFKKDIKKPRRLRNLFSVFDGVIEAENKENIFESMREKLFLMGACV